MRLVVFVITFLFPLLISTQEKPFLLILGFDGLSYQLATELFEAGHFRNFQRPIPLVASFPSISDPNWAHIMKTPLEKSFTKAHFDNTPNEDGTIGKEVGTIINHLIAPPQYEKAFDFRPEGLVEHLMSVTWSKTSALFWMESLSRMLTEKKILDENQKPKDNYRAFIMNTDIISHVGGKTQMVEYFKKVEKNLKKLKKDFEKKFGRTLEILIISDHGNYFTTPKAIDFEKSLKLNKWTKNSTLKNKKDYAFVAPEIISFGAFFTFKEQEENLAKEFINIEGVHVALVDKGKNTIAVFSPIGEALITVDPAKETLKYKITHGKDPFNQQELFQNKTLSFEDYFYKTLHHDYPNALVGAWEAFYKNTQLKPSVLVSPKLGYVFTNLTLEILTALSGVQSTHGSFHKEESLGVLMTTLKIKDEALRPRQFLDLLSKNNYKIETVFSEKPTAVVKAKLPD